MNSDTVVLLLQKGFRVTLGATASLVEVLQNPQKREQNLAKLRLELSQLAEELAEKGEITEREARTFVDGVLSQRQNASSAASETTVTTTATSVQTNSPEVQLELQELTAQLAAIRAELERLRSQGGQ